MAVVREGSLTAISGDVNGRLLGVVDDVLDARLTKRQGAEVTEGVDVGFFEVVEESVRYLCKTFYVLRFTFYVLRPGRFTSRTFYVPDVFYYMTHFVVYMH